METNKNYNLGCLELMGRMEDDFVDLTVTSPPYDNLRSYCGYDFDFERIAGELFRVTKDGGVVVWVVGDATKNGSETGTSFRQALHFIDVGFRLHDTMFYEKAGMSAPSNNRYHNVVEYMFILSKGTPNAFNGIKDRKNRWTQRFGKPTRRQKDGSLKHERDNNFTPFGLRFNIWRYNTGYGYSATDDVAYEHPAIMPEKLAADHIKTWSNEGDLVYDPFAGSGTTLKMAHLLNRKWLGSEVSEEYCALIDKRMDGHIKQMIMPC